MNSSGNFMNLILDLSMELAIQQLFDFRIRQYFKQE